MDECKLILTKETQLNSLKLHVQLTRLCNVYLSICKAFDSVACKNYALKYWKNIALADQC